MDTYIEINPRRTCKCESHVSDAKWHGSVSGKNYHACTCASCLMAWRNRATVKCSLCGGAMTSTKSDPVCMNCRIKAGKERAAAKPKKPVTQHGLYGETTTQRFIRRRKELWILQNGICALCHAELALIDACLDHDHSCCDVSVKKSCGKCDRGVLHNHCNSILGFARDEVKLLAQAIEYLENRGIDNGPSME